MEFKNRVALWLALPIIILVMIVMLLLGVEDPED